MVYRTVRPMVVDAVRAEKPMDVETSDGPLHVERGEWLVREQGGGTFVCDANYFARTFEKLESSANPEQGTEGKPCGC